jgi:hypothetical protein
MRAICTRTAVAAALAGCASATPPPAAPPPPATTSAELVYAGCPLGVSGAQVVVTDTESGVDLTFTATSHVTELRRRVREAAAMHGRGAYEGEGHDGRHATGGNHGLQPMQLPPARAEVDAITHGARMHVAPIDPADRDALRAKLRERAAKMVVCD